MTIGIVATLSIVEGKNAEFEQAFAEQAAQVKEKEPGCTLYALHKSRDNAQTYIVMEQYADQAALNAHAETAHMKTFSAKAGAFFSAAPQIQLLDAV